MVPWGWVDFHPGHFLRFNMTCRCLSAICVCVNLVQVPCSLETVVEVWLHVRPFHTLGFYLLIHRLIVKQHVVGIVDKHFLTVELAAN